MYKITDEISKEVLSVSEALPLGIITNAYVGERLSRVKGWLVSKDDSDEDGLLEMRRVLGRGDAVTVMNAGAVKPPRGIRSLPRDRRERASRDPQSGDSCPAPPETKAETRRET